MENPKGLPSLRTISMIIGAALIVMGVLFLLGELFKFQIAGWFWPLFVLVPGLMLLVWSVGQPGANGEGVSSVAGAICMTGLLLFFQNITGFWSTWAYAWALVAPAGLGVGLWIYGWRNRLPDKVRDGQRMILVGLIIFLAGFIFFEGLLGISGFNLGGYIGPLMLIGLGVLLLWNAFRKNFRKGQ